jgi:DNA-binding Xre family transcriptional regulator
VAAELAMLASAKMIQSMLKQVATAKGYPNAKRLTEALQAIYGTKISNSGLYPYWNDTVKNFNREMLDRLCEFLDVPLGLLIQYVNTDSLRKKRLSKPS